MVKRTVDDVDVRGKRVLVRLDLNVPLDSSQCITDDRRIQAALPTVRRLMEGGGRVILMSHLGRPDGGVEDRAKYSLAPVAARLGELLGKPVRLADDCVGDSVTRVVAALREGDVCVLENLRFHKAETIKDKKAVSDAALRETKTSFAAQLAAQADVYVNDAFGTCHRDNASMLTVPQLMPNKPRVIGYLVQRELEFLGGAIANPARPFVCLLGGAKVSDKLAVIRELLGKCDTILIGGAMAYTFLAAQGMAVGKSLVEPDLFDTARDLRAQGGDRLRLPVDSVVGAEMTEGTPTAVCDSSIPPDRMGLDIGPRTIDLYKSVILEGRPIVWNGPMGVFELPPFDRGTMALASAMAEATRAGATTIVGGGDSAAAIGRAGVSERITHVSTGGGAALEFLQGKAFAAIDVLDDM